jgi:hypothetical protein
MNDNHSGGASSSELTQAESIISRRRCQPQRFSQSGSAQPKKETRSANESSQKFANPKKKIASKHIYNSGTLNIK